jgi:hypothetical protein
MANNYLFGSEKSEIFYFILENPDDQKFLELSLGNTTISTSWGGLKVIVLFIEK